MSEAPAVPLKTLIQKSEKGNRASFWLNKKPEESPEQNIGSIFALGYATGNGIGHIGYEEMRRLREQEAMRMMMQRQQYRET